MNAIKSAIEERLGVEDGKNILQKVDVLEGGLKELQEAKKLDVTIHSDNESIEISLLGSVSIESQNFDSIVDDKNSDNEETGLKMNSDLKNDEQEKLKRKLMKKLNLSKHAFADETHDLLAGIRKFKLKSKKQNTEIKEVFEQRMNEKVKDSKPSNVHLNKYGFGDNFL